MLPHSVSQLVMMFVTESLWQIRDSLLLFDDAPVQGGGLIRCTTLKEKLCLMNLVLWHLDHR